MLVQQEMFEERVAIASGGFRLSGRAFYLPGALSRGGVLFCPPHPALGGNMGNNVIVTVAGHVAARGWHALRFDYRGVGESEGERRGAVETFEYWQNRETGAAEEELDDVIAATDCLSERCGGEECVVVGYSFGAALALKAAGEGRIDPDLIVGIAPPIDDIVRYKDNLSGVPAVLLYGDKDFASPVERVRTTRFPPSVRVEILPDCDHFFIGVEQRLARVVADQLP